MKNFMLAIVFGMFSVASARAESITLSVNQIIGLQNALSQLDQPYQDTDPAGKAVSKRYRFELNTRIIFARNLAVLTVIINGIQEQRQQILQDALPPSDKKASAKNSELQTKLFKLGDLKESLQLNLLSIADLGLDSNPIPTIMLSELSPIISDWRK
jgi:hypothetical protein